VNDKYKTVQENYSFEIQQSRYFKGRRIWHWLN